MKILFTIVIALSIASHCFAQVPEKLSYQAVIRNSNDDLVANQEIGIQISILQSSADGTSVYVETQTTTTNYNGLLSIIIGEGSVESGEFESIDWSSDTFFLKTEIDITGGTSYTITGSSQLLSVPYALHAKTAESVTSSYNIGDLYGGGVIFLVDSTGEHGLIVSMVDLSTSYQWSNITDTNIGTTNSWDGDSNTTAIINQEGHSNSASQLCNDYTNNDYDTGIYSDWYLPGITELSLIDYHLYEINKAISNDGNSLTTEIEIGHYEENRSIYWSSTEYDSGKAYCYILSSKYRAPYGKSGSYKVRAIRAF
ncbi:Lcl domain-containing protein [Saccharicrinis fermentans]|uniref:Lcl C-terminal domain-containing protein n=1 Tax=Saccharicrinis fermentans DSM 9555 = JCM 21142 TaxID=869213 RepID=W7Y163_9BACT|nr:DUF1566 domain-containing protein [Saccharicrinis fermentans]GAF04650.1 hypothetical protein JCM21142_93362 [Saccharicrinis fermentans DSM 9555 = JCM 21142]